MARTCCCYSGYLSDFTFRSCRHIFLVFLPRNCRTSLKKCPLAAFCHMHMTPSHWNFEKKTHKTEMILIRTQSVKLTACSMTNLTSFLEPRCPSIEPKLFNIAVTLTSFYRYGLPKHYRTTFRTSILLYQGCGCGTKCSCVQTQTSNSKRSSK